MAKQRADLTFKYNRDKGRHGWIRLTPAYSIKAVYQFLKDVQSTDRILDPFSGTGTTGLICAENNIPCTLIDINPFLVWLARVKTRHYDDEIVDIAAEIAQQVSKEQPTIQERLWAPPIQFIDRWWSPQRLNTLAQLFAQIQSFKATAPPPSIDLLLVAFCRLVIQWSNAAFNHQSMSFKANQQSSLFTQTEPDEMRQRFRQIAFQITQSARSPIRRAPLAIEGDSRKIDELIDGPFTRVITSPPYPNRMSYIRELRPYMYWLGYLSEARQAGELDWQAIGGTWGIATSRLVEWKPNGAHIAYANFDSIIGEIANSGRKNGALLANYIQRYFVDIVTHLTNLKKILVPDTQIIYIVGNSKFYNTLVPVEKIYASIMQQCGFVEPKIELLRKRNSKKELYEYVVSARAGM
ncbi:MAG: hypothetical protein JXB47_02355 [Anaerolineae bacterium]|nr:hypothetical protein [Anaerolineae bacterium]